MIDKNTLRRISTNLYDHYQAYKSGHEILEKRLAEPDLLSLWEIASSLNVSPLLGFDMAQPGMVNATNLPTNSLSGCDTLKQALDIVLDNMVVHNESESWAIKDQSDAIKLSFKFDSMHPYPIMAIERSMAALIIWAQHFTSSRIRLKNAQFAFSKPPHHEKYSEVFGANIVFDATENIIEIPHSELNKTIQGANPYLRDLIAQGSDNTALEAPRLTLLKVKVKVLSLLKADLMTYCHVEAQLKMLNMSKATLYRKLKQEGTSFSEIVLKERLAILSARQKVHTHYSNEQSSEALGFKDVNAFYKFLKKNNLTKK